MPNNSNQKKYASLSALQTFLNNLKVTFADLDHKHTVGDITDYKVDNQLSSTSNNPIANKTVNDALDAARGEVTSAMGFLESAIKTKADSAHDHSSLYYEKSEVDGSISGISSSISTHAGNSDIHVTTTNKSNWNSAYTHSTSTHAPSNAERNIVVGIQRNGTDLTVDSTTRKVNITVPTTAAEIGAAIAGHNHDDKYDAKGSAASALKSANTYAEFAANAVKDDLLNNAGAAYDTLKELGDLIVGNAGAIEALEKIAAGKANATHTHAISDVSGLQSALDSKAASSHGTHVTYSTTAPVMDGTASVGAASTVARSDHKHPTDTSRASKTEFDSHDTDTTKHIAATERTNWNAAKTHADSTHAPSDAEKNQNAFSNITVGSTTIAADTATDTVTFVGSNVTITPDATNDKITFAVADGTTSVKGVVKLTNSTSSTSTTTAATPNSVKSAYDLANTAKTNAATAQETAESAYTLAEGKVDSLSDLGITATAAELNYVDGVTSNIQTQLDGKSASSHTHNYAGSSSAGGAATSANKVNKSLTVKLNGGTTEGTNLFTFNGSAAKSVDITPSAIGAAASSHTHDDRYYTETEIDAKLSDKANTSHGNHVPATGTASNKVFLRNDNTWATVTPANIGAAASSHTHTVANITDLTVTATELNYMDGVTSNVQTQLDGKSASSHNHSAANITSGTISTARLPAASGTAAGITIVYPSASCTTFSSDSGTITPLAAQKAAKMFAITRPSSTTNKAIARYSNTTGDVQNSKIIIEDVTNSKDTSKKANVIAIPAEGNKKMVYGYCTDQVDGTSFIGGVFDANATEYPYSAGLAIGGTSGNLLWKGAKVATATDLSGYSKTSHTHPVASASANGLMSASDKTKVDAIGAYYYNSLSAAITDINDGVTTNAVSDASSAKVKVYAADNGRTTVKLIADVTLGEKLIIYKDIDLVLNGKTLTLTTVAAHLSFSNQTSYGCINGEAPGSTITKTGVSVSSSDTNYLINAASSNFFVKGGTYNMSVTVNNAISINIRVGNAERAEFNNCTFTSTNSTSTDTKVLRSLQTQAGTTIIKYCTFNSQSRIAQNIYGMNEVIIEDSTLVSKSIGTDVGSAAQSVYVNSGNTVTIKNSIVKGDAAGCHVEEAYSTGISNSGTLYLDNCNVSGTHSGITASTNSKTYISGGTYTGYCHGGVYCGCTDGEVFINDAILRSGNYEGDFDYSGKTGEIYGALYIGGGAGKSNISVYLDNCTIILDANTDNGICMRGTSGECNNTLNISNSTITGTAAESLLRIDEGKGHKINIGVGGNITPSMANRVWYVSTTNELYRKVPEGKECNGRDYGSMYDWFKGRINDKMPTYTNILDEVGYKSNTRISASNNYAEVSHDYVDLTGFIPVKYGDIVRLKNVIMSKNHSDGNTRQIIMYNSSKTCTGNNDLKTLVSTGAGWSNTAWDSNNNISYFTYGGADSYIRIAAERIDETSIITINEEIQ